MWLASTTFSRARINTQICRHHVNHHSRFLYRWCTKQSTTHLLRHVQACYVHPAMNQDQKANFARQISRQNTTLESTNYNRCNTWHTSLQLVSHNIYAHFINLISCAVLRDKCPNKSNSPTLQEACLPNWRVPLEHLPREYTSCWGTCLCYYLSSPLTCDKANEQRV